MLRNGLVGPKSQFLVRSEKRLPTNFLNGFWAPGAENQYHDVKKIDQINRSSNFAEENN